MAPAPRASRAEPGDSTITHLLLNLFLSAGYLGIIIAMAAESCCLPLPSELIMPLAGFLAFQGRLNLVGVALAGAVGCLAGSAIAYWIGATGGRPLLLRYGRYILITPRDAERADQFFARHGESTVFLTRLMPIVRTFISLPAGIARMNLPRFLVYTFLGSLPWCFVLAFAGYQLGRHWDRISTVLHGYDAFIGLAVIGLIVLALVRRKVNKQAEVSESDWGEERTGTE